MSKFLDKQSSDALYRAIVSIQNEEECRKFLEDLCTVSELKAMQQRMDVARFWRRPGPPAPPSAG